MADKAREAVMLVDDVEANIDLLTDVLGDDYQVFAALDGETALEDIANGPPDLILLDIMMPGLNGYEVCRRLKANPRTRDIPVIFLSALTGEDDEVAGLKLGAVDYIAKPFTPALVRARVRNHLELKKHRDGLAELVRARTRELAITKEVTIDGLAALAEYRDPETGGHIQRTKYYVRLLAEALRRQPRFQKALDEESLELLYKSAPLHDIGKVGVPDHILFKPGPLSAEEFTAMQKHAEYGANAIRRTEEKLPADSFLAFARQIAQTHHERWDGTGYPGGLRGDAIPLGGRLMALADVYDALISRRVYKAPLSHRRAVEIIIQGDGRTRPSHFDPEVLAVFAEQEAMFRQIAFEHADSQEERETLGC
ncbi:MAG: HD domain-containing phosphohydrolase [Thermodesulfobacteriota bacterium]